MLTLVISNHTHLLSHIFIIRTGHVIRTQEFSLSFVQRFVRTLHFFKDFKNFYVTFLFRTDITDF